MKFIISALGSLIIGMVASARLPDPNISAKDAFTGLEEVIEVWTDNPSEETALRFKESLAKARRAGAIKGFEGSASYNEDQLKRTAKYIKVAANCEVSAVSAEGFHMKSWTVPLRDFGGGPPTSKQLQAYVDACPGAVKAIARPLPSVTTGQ